MRSLYKNQYVDYNGGKTEFVEEFNRQIKDYGAICYNHATNTYQYIRKFEEAEFINEIDPWYFSVKPSRLPNGIDIEMQYGFDPYAFLDDPEITSLWRQAVEEGLPVYDYDEEQDGEIYTKDVVPLTNNPTRHTIWILDKGGQDFVYSHDKLAILPMIKYLPIARELITNHTVKPFDDDPVKPEK